MSQSNGNGRAFVAPTITRIARTEHACAMKVAETYGVSLEYAVTKMWSSVNRVFNSARIAGLLAPDDAVLPKLNVEAAEHEDLDSLPVLPPEDEFEMQTV